MTDKTDLHEAAADVFANIGSLVETYAKMIDWESSEVVAVLAENFPADSGQVVDYDRGEVPEIPLNFHIRFIQAMEKRIAEVENPSIPKTVDLTDWVIDFLFDSLGPSAIETEGPLGDALAVAQSYLEIGFRLGYKAGSDPAAFFGISD